MNIPLEPEVLRCYFETSVLPHLPAMHLRWPPDAPGVAERSWHLPDGVIVKGPAPRHFGVTINRHGPNTYQVRVLWNQLYLSWQNLTRLQIMTSALAPLLRALGTDVWNLLEQPAQIEQKLASVAA